MENGGRLLFTREMKNGSPRIKKSKTSLQVSKDLWRVLISLSAFIEVVPLTHNDVIYQTRMTVLDHISKYREES